MMGRFALVLSILALCFAVAAFAEHGKPLLRIIADTDTPVPGGGGQNFAGFFHIDPSVSPDISGRNIVFAGCCPTGIYSWFDGELGVIADLSSTYPGTGNPLGFFVSSGSSPSISGSNVAFACSNGRPGPGAICAYIDGRLESVAEGGTTLVPGTNETFGTFFALNGSGPSISGTNVAFFAFWSGGGGVYARINGELLVIADSASNSKIISDPSISGARVAFLHGGIKSGISVYKDGQIDVIADINTPAPGTTGTFCGFSTPVLDGGNLGFGACTDIGAGMYALIDGGLELIANRNTLVPGHDDTTFDHFGSNSGMTPSFSGENMVFYGNGRLPGKKNQRTNGIYARIHDAPIPTASTWGLIALTLLLLSAGIVLLRGRAEVGRDKSAM